MASDFASVDIDVDDVAGIEVVHVAFERQGTRIFHGVEENRCDFTADADAAVALVGNVRNVVADIPQHRVRCRLTRGARAHDIAN